MAKGNPLLGQLRGSVGDVVFSRFGGQQVSRARNRNPKNPQSLAQMIQRAKLGSAVAFFSRGQQNLFKFAFESKRANESDYNAFMRYNINRVVPNTKAAVLRGNTIVGKFMMTQGTLPHLKIHWSESISIARLDLTGFASSLTAATLTVGDISKAIISQYGLQDGDIITKVLIMSSHDLVIDTESALEEGTYVNTNDVPSWTIKQFRLDSASTALASTLSDIFNLTDWTPAKAGLNLGGPELGFKDVDNYIAISLVASRPVAQGVKVSNSFLHANFPGYKVNMFAENAAWLEFVGRSWKETSNIDVTPDAILKGSLSVQ